MGRPKVEINVAEVERLAGLGLSQAEIALSLGLSEDTLGRRKKDSADFAEAIKRGRAKAGGEVANKLFGLCLEGNISAIIWYEKTRRGLTDKVVVRTEDLDAAIDRELEQLARQRRSEAGGAPTIEAEGVS